MSDAFSWEALNALGDAARATRCVALAAALRARLRDASEFQREVLSIVEELRLLGHPLWNIDEDTDRAVWGPDYTTPPSKGLLLEFHAPHSVDVSWEDRSDSDGKSR